MRCPSTVWLGVDLSDAQIRFNYSFNPNLIGCKYEHIPVQVSGTNSETEMLEKDRTNISCAMQILLPLSTCRNEKSIWLHSHRAALKKKKAPLHFNEVSFLNHQRIQKNFTMHLSLVFCGRFDKENRELQEKQHWITFLPGLIRRNTRKWEVQAPNQGGIS